jgi:predicted helicase
MSTPAINYNPLAAAPALSHYLKTIAKELSAGNSTEHTHRPALKSLIESLGSGLTATNEPKRIKCGAPDFIVTHGQTPLGYIETKDVGVPLDKAEKTDQIKRYRDSLGNLILTDYLEFRWYVSGENRMTARLAKLGRNGNLVIEKGGQTEAVKPLEAFISHEGITVVNSKDLAVRMAHTARLIHDTIRRALEEEDEHGPLHQQMGGFREVLIHDLTKEQFADMYAQTICYGLFTARCHANKGERFTRQHAAYDLPKTNPFLRKLFNEVAGPELDLMPHAWAVDDLAELLNRADIGAILHDFGWRTRREDPVVHFYETFLAAYNPKLREKRGVYYTPEPVVSYIVRSVDQILKTDFNLAGGLADASKVKSAGCKNAPDVHRVLILDPAAGTGTFLYSVINHIFKSFKNNRGMWSSYVSKHLLPRLFGFELLMAPYTVAHLKLDLLLDQTGYNFETNERLRVHLTNTLEEAHDAIELPLFAQEIATEANEASRIKQEAPVMIVLGNPPYSVSSQNKGEWISKLIEDYKKDLNEKKLNLDDDFIKFIRFAQWRIEQTGHGILAFITNHTYLDGITHRRMRESLMETFDDIYILDLHGNSKKKERSPDGSKDENVFDIQQGVAIGIFVKKPKIKGKVKVRHADLWGARKNKYASLLQTDVKTTAWKELDDINRESRLGKFYFFTPKAFDNIDEYCEGWSIKEIFAVQQNAIKTDRDELFYDFKENSLTNRMKAFYSEEGLGASFREKYKVEDSSSYNLLSRRLNTAFDTDNIHQSLYRPFDVRYLYYAPGLTSRPAWEVMNHMLAGANLGLITTRQTSDEWDCLATHTLCGHKSCAAYDINSLFPLYLYLDDSKESLFDNYEATDAHGRRRPNLAPDFLADFSSRLRMTFIPDGKGDRLKTLGPEDIFNYMYAVFHSPTYRSRYAEFLKINFPRLPLTSNKGLFGALCQLGEELVYLHIMKKKVPIITRYPIPGNNAIEHVQFTSPREDINKR